MRPSSLEVEGEKRTGGFGAVYEDSSFGIRQNGLYA